ncbi:MAG: EF-P lysine aminoacylase GenX, partial [Gammaproteobacteria bacterium]|nr:EF-P lysine aminoacylase GenX [Gammaproteobacteria bacterium]
TKPPLRLSYTQAFAEHLDVDAGSSEETIAAALVARRIEVPEKIDRRGLLDLALGTAIIPGLPRDRLIYIYDFPADQAALARLKESDPAVAARFEVFANGIELANGFAELTDAREQRARFEAERLVQMRHGGTPPPIDEALLAALAHGLPECAGVAVGVDRLVAVAAG